MSKEALERIKKSHYIAMICMGIDKPDIETEKAIKAIEKELEALEIIKEQGFLFVEKGQLYCGRYGDIEVLLEEDDFQDKQEYELLKEVFENE